jgi:hypothetical protein
MMAQQLRFWPVKSMVADWNLRHVHVVAEKIRDLRETGGAGLRHAPQRAPITET